MIHAVAYTLDDAKDAIEKAYEALWHAAPDRVQYCVACDHEAGCGHEPGCGVAILEEILFYYGDEERKDIGEQG